MSSQGRDRSRNVALGNPISKLRNLEIGFPKGERRPTVRVRSRVFVAMSGGVDSSVSAALLKQSGYDVTGVYIRIWQPEWGPCTVREDERDAMRVCAKLGIPFRSLDLTGEYRREVVENMIREYAAGRTPNPDVMCNRDIKFGAFLKWALAEGADLIATGHYAQIRKLQATSYKLIPSPDREKDQTYFLWTLTQDHLRHTLFPVGRMKKRRVRRLAKQFGLPNAEKKDSQGLCFLGMIDVKDFITSYVPEKVGAVMSVEGETIGVHRGAHLYTIGQRHGLSHGVRDPGIRRMYVAAKDIEANTIIVAPRRENKGAGRQGCTLELESVNWINDVPKRGLVVEGRIRYREPLGKARILSTDQNGAVLQFQTPRHSPAAGQSAVIYKGDVCLGGGVISKAY